MASTTPTNSIPTEGWFDIVFSPISDHVAMSGDALPYRAATQHIKGVNFASTQPRTVPKTLWIANRALLFFTLFFAANILCTAAGLFHTNGYINVVYGTATGGLYFVFSKAERMIRRKTSGI